MATFTPRPMHPSLTRVVSQAHVTPLLRPAVTATGAYVMDTGYQPVLRDEWTRVGTTFPVSPRSQPGAGMLANEEEQAEIERFTVLRPEQPCADCRAPFRPKAGNQVRCLDCYFARRALDLRKTKTGQKRRKRVPKPRLVGRKAAWNA